MLSFFKVYMHVMPPWFCSVEVVVLYQPLCFDFQEKFKVGVWYCFHHWRQTCAAGAQTFPNVSRIGCQQLFIDNYFFETSHWRGVICAPVLGWHKFPSSSGCAAGVQTPLLETESQKSLRATTRHSSLSHAKRCVCCRPRSRSGDACAQNEFN